MKSVFYFAVVCVLALIVLRFTGSRPASPGHRSAADGVYYLRQYVSFQTARGAVGLAPGQEVRLAGQAAHVPGKIVVTDGVNTVALSPGYLTNDLDVADALRAADDDVQALAQTQVNQASDAQNELQQAQQAGMANEINATDANRASASVVGGYRSHLNAPAGAGPSYYYPPAVVYYPAQVPAAVTLPAQTAAATLPPATSVNRPGVTSMPLNVRTGPFQPVAAGPTTRPVNGGHLQPPATRPGALSH